ncbi:MAG: HAMP domain-containing histidine kinase [Lachnospiraceae bacterium]|nr:HAMP domain-containing histidine kinase [Lachnospiraceae bacterium]
MRLFSKVFFSITAILCLALALSGYLMMSAYLKDNYARETERAAEAYRLTSYALQTVIRTGSGVEQARGDAIERAAAEVPHTGLITILSSSGTPLYDEYEGRTEMQWSELDNTAVICRLQQEGNRMYVRAAGAINLNGSRLYLVVSDDVTALSRQTDRQISNYRIFYLAICGIGLVAVSVVSARLVGPIGRTARSAEKIAKGQYDTRVKVTSNDELGDLGRSFNRMAEAVDASVVALQTAAEEKEEFVDNFAHELKTPLTSVIGYADMLTQKDLPEEQVRTYAQYILDEGLRLEALSYKLMELIVLNKQDFVLEALHAGDLFENIAEGLAPLFGEKGVEAEYRIDEAYLRVEFDLFKTMMLNLIDNAVKADARRIEIGGKAEEEHYVITIRDDGRGMPKEALSRITEAFYMVDKSRSRAQHGAGLGLALVKRIVELHQATLTFDSKEGQGTMVSVIMPLRKEDMTG